MLPYLVDEPPPPPPSRRFYHFSFFSPFFFFLSFSSSSRFTRGRGRGEWMPPLSLLLFFFLSRGSLTRHPHARNTLKLIRKWNQHVPNTARNTFLGWPDNEQSHSIRERVNAHSRKSIFICQLLQFVKEWERKRVTVSRVEKQRREHSHHQALRRSAIDSIRIEFPFISTWNHLPRWLYNWLSY